ncbi:MAG: hypothetical protein JWM76_977 [Pseudonocardiales bacterium]|nr:hypothetical protein [Pseudonocardiales bacterium]
MSPARELSSRSITASIPRLRTGERILLSPREPVVALNRLQSGIGVLSFEMAASARVGDLRIGCAYELTDGHSSTVQSSDGTSTAPRGSREPVIFARNDGFEHLLIDLRQTRRLVRALFFGFSASEQPLNWGGTLIVNALGGARVELPLDIAPSVGVTALMSVINVDGEFVVRGEMELINGSIRDACVAYGYDRITWVDDRHPAS